MLFRSQGICIVRFSASQGIQVLSWSAGEQSGRLDALNVREATPGLDNLAIFWHLPDAPVGPGQVVNATLCLDSSLKEFDIQLLVDTGLMIGLLYFDKNKSGITVLLWCRAERSR